MITSDLYLGGEWDEQWCAYVKGLTHGGIRIGIFEDTLLDVWQTIGNGDN